MTPVEWTIVLRAALAGLLGYWIGWERNVFGEPVRARAIALASTTAAILVAMTQAYYPEETARVVAGIVTGIGFLGAGAILRSPSGEVRGHTTAAGLWAMSAIGMAVGSGHELLGILLAFVLYTIIAVSEWPLLTRLNQVWAQKRGRADTEAR
jgi:putative Mg2+ transporter-C (MgtC) family protein